MGYFGLTEISRGSLAVWRRNFDAFIRTYKVNFIPPFVEPVLYLLALGYGVGALIEDVNGIPYPVFIAPALVSISVMYSAFFECTYSSYVRMYYQKTFDAIIATPLSIEDIVTGEILWGATRGTIYAGLMIPVLFLFGVIDLPISLLLIPCAIPAGILFASIGICFTAITPSIDSLNYPAFLFITPMFLFSGTFFPISILPESLQYFAFGLLPLANVVSLNRAITAAEFSPLILYNIIWIIGVAAIFFVIGLNLMRRRLII
ncbi:ABC transporter permease [Methanocalculus chunghsingensis]|uniref:ABC transporter permease n=1 Tax=Methanocalculus chunghsingensis TaxID=156457 RepID=A0A8J7W7S1_9EURY|nr:ABC transporter permease [Methanocalculus chunghsingensis]MBR1368190.1 ABC transporter permease [Methanocalculus chunghsingensis]